MVFKGLLRRLFSEFELKLVFDVQNNGRKYEFFENKYRCRLIVSEGNNSTALDAYSGRKQNILGLETIEYQNFQLALRRAQRKSFIQSCSQEAIQA